jgi:hypothetical protein
MKNDDDGNAFIYGSYLQIWQSVRLQMKHSCHLLTKIGHYVETTGMSSCGCLYSLQFTVNGDDKVPEQ